MIDKHFTNVKPTHRPIAVEGAELVVTCDPINHDYAHAEVPAEGRVYLYCRKCGDTRLLTTLPAGTYPAPR